MSHNKLIKFNIYSLTAMNLTKSQPISYKDFIKKVEQASNKENKLTKNAPINKSQKKITLNRTNAADANCKTPHTQSTSIWDKPSTSRSKAKKKQTGTCSHNQSITQRQNSTTKSQKKKDNTLCYYGFVKQATNALTNIIQVSSPELLSHKISYIQYLQAMKNLKMIRETYQPFPNDLVSELWSEYMTGESVGNFILVLCSILGINFEGQSTEADQYVKKKYESLHFTRLQLNGASHSTRGQPKIQYSFRPQISERSRKLATSRSKSKSKNKKHLGCINTERANTSIGYCDGLSSLDEYDENNYNVNTEHISTNSKSNVNGIKRSQLLYELAKQKMIEKRDKDRNLIDYERNKKELTFKPKIMKSKSKEKVKCRIKGEKITISRMIRGRVEREVRKIIEAKGLPYNEKTVERLKKQKYEEIINEMNVDFEREPSEEILVSENDQEVSHPKCNQKIEQAYPENNYLIPCQEKQFSQNIPKLPNNNYQLKPFMPEQDLVIDVYIAEDHKEKLVIRKGQALEEVATAFVKQHNLSESKIQQLIELLTKSIKHALCPIDELVEEQDMQMLSARTYKPQDF